MAKASIVLSFLFLVIFISVENMVRAGTCSEGLGQCGKNNCDSKCKARRGPSGQGSCDTSTGVGLCTCSYPCGPPGKTPPPKVKTCNSGLGQCSGKCGPACCNQNCAKKYSGGTGICNSVGTTNLCQCTYPC